LYSAEDSEAGGWKSERRPQPLLGFCGQSSGALAVLRRDQPRAGLPPAFCPAAEWIPTRPSQRSAACGR